MPTKSNIKEFIEKAKKKHGDKYDYSLVKYIDSNTKVIIICKKHGKFEQKPYKHLSGQGCSKCSGCYKYTTKEWIEKAKEVHGDKYDYSKVEYKKALEKIIIICIEHGEFKQTPNKHLNGRQGCIQCGILSASNKNRSNTEEFIKKSKEIHGDKYDYSKVEYIDSYTNVIIICKKHGEFKQTPNCHLRYQGCKKCGYLNNSIYFLSNTEEFIKKAKEIHGDKYDYSLVEYIDSDTKVIIICKKHGKFKQKPSGHLTGYGCSKCSGTYQYTTKEWVEKVQEVHGDKYDYSKVKYINNKINVIIICKKHGKFEQIPNSHLSGKGCKKCSGNYQYTTEEWIEKAKEVHGDKYDYSKVEYIDKKTNVIIICKKHGKFEQNPNSHLRNRGCPLCINKTEGKLYKILKKKYTSLISQFSPIWIGKKRFDFCIPENNIIIELDGPQHFIQVSNWPSPEEQVLNDKEKEKLANENNYCIIRLLQEDVFYDTYNWFDELLENIKILINKKPIIQNIYMDKNNEYKHFL